jgi:hypothetical protein
MRPTADPVRQPFQFDKIVAQQQTPCVRGQHNGLMVRFPSSRRWEYSARFHNMSYKIPHGEYLKGGAESF